MIPTMIVCHSPSSPKSCPSSPKIDVAPQMPKRLQSSNNIFMLMLLDEDDDDDDDSVSSLDTPPTKPQQSRDE